MTTEKSIGDRLKIYYIFKFSAKRASEITGCCHQTACKYFNVFEASGEQRLTDKEIIEFLEKNNF